MQTEVNVIQASVDFNKSKGILTELKSERDELKRKIELASKYREVTRCDEIAELRDRLFEVEEMEMPFAELMALEAGIRYCEATMTEAQRVEIQRRVALDGLFDVRERSIAELRKLIHDESHEVSAAQEKYLASQHEIQEIGNQLSLYKQRLRELKSRSDKTGIRQAQLGPLTLSYVALI